MNVVLVEIKTPLRRDLLQPLVKLKSVSVPVFFLDAKIVKEKQQAQEFAAALRRILELRRDAAYVSATRAYPQNDWQSVSLVQLADTMQIPRSTLAQILGTTERNLARWVGGKTKPTGNHVAALQRLKYIYALLFRAFKKEAVPRYLKEPNPSLGGRIPLRLLVEHDFATVEADLLQLVEGVYS